MDIVKLIERKVVVGGGGGGGVGGGGGGYVFLNLLIDSPLWRIYLKMKPTSLFHWKIRNSAFQF